MAKTDIEDLRSEGKKIVDDVFDTMGIKDGPGGSTAVTGTNDDIDDDSGGGDGAQDVDDAALGTGDTGAENEGDEHEVDELDEVEAGADAVRKERDDKAKADQDADDKAKGVDRAGQVRDQRGQWRKMTPAELAEKAKSDEVARVASETQSAADALAEAERQKDPKVIHETAAKAADEHLSKMQWQGLGVTVQGQMLEMPEAQWTRAGNHTLIRLPNDKVAAFQSRLVKGAVGERIWRDLGVKQREAEREKAAPARETDGEIAARLTADALAPFIPEFLTEEQVNNLELRIKVAQRDAADKHGEDRKKYFDDLDAKERESNAGPAEEHQREERVTNALFEVLKGDEFKGLTEPEIRAVHQELMELRRVVWGDDKNPEQWYFDDRRIAAALRNVQSRRSAAQDAGTTGTPDKGTTPTSAAPAAIGTKDVAQDKHEQHNESARAGVRAPSTSLSRRRDAGPTRRNGAPPGTRRSPADNRSKQQIAEDESRVKTNAFLRSNSLDDDSLD